MNATGAMERSAFTARPLMIRCAIGGEIITRRCNLVAAGERQQRRRVSYITTTTTTTAEASARGALHLAAVAISWRLAAERYLIQLGSR